MNSIYCWKENSKFRLEFEHIEDFFFYKFYLFRVYCRHQQQSMANTNQWVARCRWSTSRGLPATATVTVSRCNIAYYPTPPTCVEKRENGMRYACAYAHVYCAMFVFVQSVHPAQLFAAVRATLNADPDNLYILLLLATSALRRERFHIYPGLSGGEQFSCA